MTTPILLVGDIHAMDKPPASVYETYMDDLIEMLEWIAHYAHENGIKAVVWAGDIFNHKQPSRTSHALVLRMIGVVQLHLSLGIELLIVVGNHDISNDVAESVHEKQPLGVLLKAGAHELDGWHATLPLFGVPWQQRWLHEDTPMEAFAKWRNPPFHKREGKDRWPEGFGQPGREEWGDLAAKALAVTHAPVYPPSTRDEQMFDLVPTAGAHGLSEAMGHVGYLYYGHIHEDHGIWEDEGVTYANMGALSRGSLHEYNVQRAIKIAAWTPEDGFTEIPVPHKPADEVFKIAERDAVQAEKKNLDSFLDEIGSSKLDISSTESVIAHIRTMDLTESVRDLSIEILENIE